MPKKQAHPKVTGGGGYAFEDKVVAYFLAFLLAGEPPFDPEFGTLVQVGLQQLPHGWNLDDVVLSLSGRSGRHRAAFSIKSNQQVTAGGFPREFVRAAWEQYLQIDNAVFDRENDFLGLVTSLLPPALKGQLDELVDWAEKQDGASLRRSVETSGVGSDEKRSLYESLRCPDDLASGRNVTDEDVGNFISHLVHEEFDFEHRNSRAKREAVSVLRQALASGSVREAISLWTNLLDLAREYSRVGGTLDLRALLKMLGQGYSFKDQPDYRQGWDRLRRMTDDAFRQIPDTIGGLVRIERGSVSTNLDEAFDKARCVVLLGPSGCGKSVAAKNWVQRLSSRFLWLDAETVARDGLPNRLELSSDFATVVRSVRAETALAVLDAVDRVSLPNFKTVSQVVHALGAEAEDSAWSLLVVCQQEEWDRVRRELRSANLHPENWAVVEMKEPSPTELAPVWKAFPSLTPLRWQRDLHSLLLRPKVLDLLARAASAGTGPDTSRWVGVSDLIEWFWEAEITGHPQGVSRSVAIARMSEMQADRAMWTIPVEDVPKAEAIDGLVADHICQMHRGRVGFDHDLYGDWSRQRQIANQGSDVGKYLAEHSRLSSPLWHRAVRLHGIALLEQNPDIGPWREAAAQIGAIEGGRVGEDLLLKAAVFAANPLPLLERLWPELAQEDGRQLRRFLRRFLATATVPNPLYAYVGETLPEPRLRVLAATWNRIPFYTQWPAVIHFLHDHFDEVVRTAPDEVVKIAGIWLRYTEPGWLLREEAARLAVHVARAVLDAEEKHDYRFSHDLAKAAFQAALAGAHELPDDVADLAMVASGRKGVPEGERGDAGEGMIYLPMEGNVQLPSPWPDGPLRSPNQEFKEVCLTLGSDTLNALISSRPAVAREVLLALLIAPPEPETHFGLRERAMQPLCIDDFHGSMPPTPWHSPWPFFFQQQPQEALEAVLRLANFATDRWAEFNEVTTDDAPGLTFYIGGEERRWMGSANVYYWYRNMGTSYPLASALMALEKWLYDLLDTGQPEEAHIGTIRDRSRSAALGGALAAVARKRPKLLEGPLRFLMTSIELLDHEVRNVDMTGFPGSMTGFMVNGNATLYKALGEWHNQPHRKNSVFVAARNLLLFKEDMRPFFAEAHAKWLSAGELARAEGSEDGYLYYRQMAAPFDISNYQYSESEDGRLAITYTPPDDIAAHLYEWGKQIERDQLLTILPFRCSQALNDGQPLAPRDAETLWHQAQSIMAQGGSADPSHAHLIPDSVCGVAAVLLLRSRDWLREEPEREEWCVERIRNTVLNPPEPPPFDSPSAVGLRYWQEFCAEAVPVLWADAPDDPSWRNCVARLAMDYHYSTVATLCKAAYRQSARLGDDFWRLQHLVRRWAVQSHDLQRLEQLSRFDATYTTQANARTAAAEKDTLLVRTARFQETLGAFESGALPLTVPRLVGLGEMEQAWRGGSIDRKRERHRKGYGFVEEIVVASYNWLPAFEAATSEGDRQTIIAWWLDIWECLLATLAPDDPNDDREIQYNVSEVEHQVMANVARVVGRMRPDERPDRFFRPMLDMACPAHDWIEAFLRSCIIENVAGGATPPTFASVWAEMIDHCFASSAWQAENGWPGLHLSDMWLYLLGLSLGSFLSLEVVWTQGQQALVDGMKTRYERWARQYIWNSRQVASFAAFLSQPAARALRPVALAWLVSALERLKKVEWKRDHVQETVAGLLATCWEQEGEAVLRSPASVPFRQLLTILLQLQDPTAIEIQQQMAASRT